MVPLRRADVCSYWCSIVTFLIHGSCDVKTLSCEIGTFLYPMSRFLERLFRVRYDSTLSLELQASVNCLMAVSAVSTYTVATDGQTDVQTPCAIALCRAVHMRRAVALELI